MKPVDILLKTLRSLAQYRDTAGEPSAQEGDDLAQLAHNLGEDTARIRVALRATKALDEYEAALEQHRELRFESSFIDRVDTHQTGGGVMVDTIALTDGQVICLTDDWIGLYPNFRAWDEETIEFTLVPQIWRDRYARD